MSTDACEVRDPLDFHIPHVQRYCHVGQATWTCSNPVVHVELNRHNFPPDGHVHDPRASDLGFVDTVGQGA